MQAFHNDEKIKSKYLARLEGHRKADEFIKGTYWENGKGCAIGCTIHSSNHKDYETELGIPEWLAYLEDRIFERLPNERAKIWPIEFLSSINVGADLEKIKAPFLIFVCESVLEQFDHNKFPDCKDAIDGVIALWKLPEEERIQDAADAADAARAAHAAYAARAAYSADVAYAAVYAAYAAYAADAADAARAAHAAYAARAASYAARAAARAVESTTTTTTAAYTYFANELLRLIKECR